jgi:hypothetical protein
MESIEKLAEVELKMLGEVKTTEELKILLRWGWGAETTNKMAIKPSEELKAGDGIKVTIEKITIVPDPIEEPVAETTAEVESEAEAVADPVSAVEAEEKTDPVDGCQCACSCECVEDVAPETSAEEK